MADDNPHVGRRVEASETLVTPEDVVNAITGVDVRRTLCDQRILICEGRCNPLLREYDGLVERYGAEPVRATLSYIMLRVRQLVYTRHERCRGEHWDPKHGWIRSFRCQVCGAVKKF